MSEYLVDENKNLVPYSEPSGSLPVVTVSIDMTSQNSVTLYCSDYGDSKDYLLHIKFNGSANDRSFYLYGCKLTENIGYLVRIVGDGSNSRSVLFWSDSYAEIGGLSLVGGTGSNWEYSIIGKILSSDSMFYIRDYDRTPWTNREIVLQCIKLW